MNMAQMSYLDQVVKCGSIASASRQLGVSRAAVSSALSSLERELEVELFVREHNSIRLTEAGRKVHELAVKLEQYMKSIQDIKDKYSKENTLRYVSTSSGLSSIMYCVNREFRARHPDTKIELLEHFNGISPDMAGGDGDFLLHTQCSEEKSLPDSLFSCPYVFFMRSGHPLARHRTLALKSVLKEYALIVYAGSADCLEARLNAGRCTRVQSLDTLRNLCSDGLSVGCIPSVFYARPFSPFNRNFRVVPCADFPLYFHITIFSSKTLSPKGKSYLSFLRAYLHDCF